MSYYYNDTLERIEYCGKVIHTVDIDMEPAPVRLRFDSENSARFVLCSILGNNPIGFHSAAHLIESEDGRPLYEDCMDDKTKETLRKQLQLLSERSKNAVNIRELMEINDAMLSVAEALCSASDDERNPQILLDGNKIIEFLRGQTQADHTPQ